MTEVSLQSNRPSILGTAFDLVDYDAALRTLEQWRQSGQRGYVTFTQAHGIVESRSDPALRRAHQGAGMVLPDGISTILAARLLGFPHKGRVSGPGFMLRCCDWGRQHNYRHFFYGGEEGVADKLAVRLIGVFPGLAVAGTYTPPFRPLEPEEDREVVRRINASKADCVWIGLSTPKQEKWMAEYRGRIAATAMLSVGAAFDFHSGHRRWAPAWVRKAGLEWIYRMLTGGRRVIARNLRCESRFTALILRDAMALRLSRLCGRKRTP